MICTDKRLKWNLFLLICCLAFIWGNSLMPGAVSGAISDWVKAILAWLLPGESETGGGGLLRKLAHFTEFATLGMLLLWRLRMLQKPGYGAWLWGTAAACVDETIQRFVPDRGPSIWDVCLDSCGVLAGMVLLHLGHTYFIKKTWRTSK